jgi:hypothetical protein
LAQGIPQLNNLLSSGDDSEAKSMVQNNFAKAEVFFQTLNVINIAQSVAITVSHLRSNSFSNFLQMCVSILAIILFLHFHDLKLHRDYSKHIEISWVR